MTLFRKIGAAFGRLPSWLRAAINTGWATFVAAVALPLLGFLGDLQVWITGAGEPPDVTQLGRLLAAALLAFVAGVVNAVFRYFKPVEQAYGPKGAP